MKNTETELSPRYYIAEASIWLLGAILVVSRFVGLAPNQALPLLDVTLRNSQQYHKVLAILMIVSFLYVVVEWKQSERMARKKRWHTIRFTFTALWVVVSLWISYPLIVHNTKFVVVSPVWYLGFTGIGFLLGLFFQVLCSAALVIRSPQESKSLGLPRVPAATRAQFLSSSPMILLLIISYYVLIAFSPSMIRSIASLFVAVPFILMVGEEWVALYIIRDKNGKRRIDRFREIYDFHDYAYQQIDKSDYLKKACANYKGDSPQAIQQKMQKEFSEPFIKFKVQLLDDIQIQLFNKDGNSENQQAQNIGVKICKHQEKRVLLIPDDSRYPKKEIKITTTELKKCAEEFIQGQPASEKLEFQQVIKHALNNAVMKTIVDYSGPNLHRAVECGQENVVVELIKRGADVNERARGGWTPLLFASAQGYPRIVRLLLEAGANPDIGNVNGITALMYAARYGNDEICQILVEYEAELDIRDMYGMTALVVACINGDLRITELLLNAGANPRIKTLEGKTALNLAYEHGHGKIAKVLKRANKKIKATGL